MHVELSLSMTKLLSSLKPSPLIVIILCNLFYGMSRFLSGPLVCIKGLIEVN